MRVINRLQCVDGRAGPALCLRSPTRMGPLGRANGVPYRLPERRDAPQRGDDHSSVVHARGRKALSQTHDSAPLRGRKAPEPRKKCVRFDLTPGTEAAASVRLLLFADAAEFVMPGAPAALDGDQCAAS